MSDTLKVAWTDQALIEANRGAEQVCDDDEFCEACRRNARAALNAAVAEMVRSEHGLMTDYKRSVLLPLGPKP